MKHTKSLVPKVRFELVSDSEEDLPNDYGQLDDHVLAQDEDRPDTWLSPKVFRNDLVLPEDAQVVLPEDSMLVKVVTVPTRQFEGKWFPSRRIENPTPLMLTWLNNLANKCKIELVHSHKVIKAPKPPNSHQIKKKFLEITARKAMEQNEAAAGKAAADVELMLEKEPVQDPKPFPFAPAVMNQSIVVQVVTLTPEERAEACKLLNVTDAEIPTEEAVLEKLKPLLAKLVGLEISVETLKNASDQVAEELSRTEREKEDLERERDDLQAECDTLRRQPPTAARAAPTTAATPTTALIPNNWYQKTKGLKITKFNGDEKEDFDEWFQALVSRMALLEIVDDQEQTNFFLMALDGKALNLMTTELGVRYKNQDWRILPFSDIAALGDEILGNQQGREIIQSAAAYSLQQGDMDIVTYYQKKLHMLEKASHGGIPQDQAEASILAGARRDIKRKFHLVPESIGNFLRQLREAERQAKEDQKQIKKPEIKDEKLKTPTTPNSRNWDQNRRKPAEKVIPKEDTPLKQDQEKRSPSNNWQRRTPPGVSPRPRGDITPTMERKCYRCQDPNHFVRDCPLPDTRPQSKNMSNSVTTGQETKKENTQGSYSQPLGSQYDYNGESNIWSNNIPGSAVRRPFPKN